MASKKSKAKDRTKDAMTELGIPTEAIKITNGPNDWDLWLCLRETKKEVNFYIDQPIKIQHKSGAAFFTGKITFLKLNQDTRPGAQEWCIEGNINKAYTDLLTFRATYDSVLRKGSVCFFYGKQHSK